MPQPLGGATSWQGAAPISRLHREAIPFLGMAASVVVVVQVLIMEAFMDLALRLLFQARLSFNHSHVPVFHFMPPFPFRLPIAIVVIVSTAVAVSMWDWLS